MVNCVVDCRVDEVLAGVRVDCLEEQLETEAKDVQPHEVQGKDSAASDKLA